MEIIKIFSQKFLLLILLVLLLPKSFLAQENNVKYTIVLHGGAGYIDPSIDESLKNSYIKSITEALSIGKKILEDGGTSLDAVEKVINYLEDDSLFNAGRGAVFTSDGTVELDASIMFGKDLSTGAVAGVKTIKNPISLARLVMEKTPHVLFAGPGADELGKQLGVEIVDQKYFFVQERYYELMKQLKKKSDGTVGCVAIDNFGNISAGTSTGGRTGKTPGRVGDSPLVNAGTYANNKTCGVSCTGIGELFIKNTIAFNVSALMEYKGISLEQSVNDLLFKTLPEGSGGIIAVDKNGNYSLQYNTQCMPRGVATSEGIFEVKIWSEDQ
jgi:beta-aspartyl-peptidase (threonine type)